jgi:hypothetical protein
MFNFNKAVLYFKNDVLYNIQKKLDGLYIVKIYFNGNNNNKNI